jgi:sialate O-acetylesterase
MNVRLTKYVAISLLLLASSAPAAVKMPKIFSDNMVLQREIPVPIWGWADKGEKVTVAFAGQEKSTLTGAEGKWTVTLEALKANKESSEIIITGSNKIAIKNVLVGEVWICSGQSNMEWTVGNSLNAKEEKDVANHPMIRHIKVQKAQSHLKQEDIASGSWEVCSPQTVSEFTAVGYFFSRQLVKELDVPVGLIGSNWGGTRIEPWTCPEGFKLVPELKNILKQVEEWDSTTEVGRGKYTDYLAQLNEWSPKAEAALAAKQAVPPVPESPLPGPDHQLPTKTYNAMIYPLIPFAIRGGIWYQGESNGNESLTYLQKMKSLIEGWRQVWKQGEFPFYHVQLANFRNSDPNKPEGGDGWAKLREAQLQSIAEIPHTGMAVIIDIGDKSDIHPKNKQDVGERLARWALVKDYKKDCVVSGPLYKGYKVEGQKIRVSFENFGSGLMLGEKIGLEPTKEIKDAKLKWIAIAGDDKVWHWAEASIDGDTLLVSSEKVPAPVAVRYAFAMNPAGANLYNKAGLPASPFRTDAW